MQSKCLLVALTALFGSSQLVTATKYDSIPRPVPVLEPVRVQGPKYGPVMWRISKEGHELWILGTVEGLPDGEGWRSREVEEKLAASKEIVTPGQAKLDWGLGDLFSAARMMPAIQRASKDSEGRSLKQVLPPNDYLRWTSMRAKYGRPDDDGIESLRPMFASERIFRQATSSAAPISVVRQVAEMAEGLHVKRVDTSVAFSIGRADKAAMKRGVQALADARIDDTGCFMRTVDGLDSAVEATRTRARAWAVGDLAAFTRVRKEALQHACKPLSEPLTGFMRVTSLPAQLASAWMATAESALVRNDVTFATMPVDELIGESGYLGRFRSRGYAVDTFYDNSDLVRSFTPQH